MLSTAVSAVIAAIWATPLPELARIVLAVYCLAIVTYEIVRGPSRNAEFKALRVRREQIAERRRELLTEADALRRRERSRAAMNSREPDETRSD